MEKKEIPTDEIFLDCNQKNGVLSARRPTRLSLTSTFFLVKNTKIWLKISKRKPSKLPQLNSAENKTFPEEICVPQRVSVFKANRISA